MSKTQGYIICVRHHLHHAVRQNLDLKCQIDVVNPLVNSFLGYALRYISLQRQNLLNGAKHVQVERAHTNTNTHTHTCRCVCVQYIRLSRVCVCVWMLPNWYTKYEIYMVTTIIIIIILVLVIIAPKWCKEFDIESFCWHWWYFPSPLLSSCLPGRAGRLQNLCFCLFERNATNPAISSNLEKLCFQTGGVNIK